MRRSKLASSGEKETAGEWALGPAEGDTREKRGPGDRKTSGKREGKDRRMGGGSDRGPEMGTPVKGQNWASGP